MKSININAKGSLYRSFHYPAGETQVRFLPEYLKDLDAADEIRVVSRITSAEDIIELALLIDAIEGVNEVAAHLSIVLPYLPYGRADRRFTSGDCLGLKVFGQLLASMCPTRVVTIDVHSDEAHNYVPELVSVSAMPLIHQAITEFAEANVTDRVTVLFPDAGARARYQLPEILGCNSKLIHLDILNASKRRHPTTGAFLGFQVPEASEFSPRPIIIVDDICDGGGTFTGLAQLLPVVPKGLYVTHGIFSKGVPILSEWFHRIWTTNTVQGSFPDEVTVLDALPLLLKASKREYDPIPEEIGA